MCMLTFPQQVIFSSSKLSFVKPHTVPCVLFHCFSVSVFLKYLKYFYCKKTLLHVGVSELLLGAVLRASNTLTSEGQSYKGISAHFTVANTIIRHGTKQFRQKKNKTKKTRSAKLPKTATSAKSQNRSTGDFAE